LKRVASITAAFEETASSLISICSTAYPERVQHAIDLLVNRLTAGNKLLVCGNGGSAADAMHICAELVGRFLRDRRPLPAIALNANPALLTALGNDYRYDSVFSRQVEALARSGDIVWGISTSGNSKNVVEALKTAHTMGAWTIGMTGEGGGALAPHADVLLAVPLAQTPRIQEVHLVTYHAICEAVEAAVCQEIPSPIEAANRP
jgi:D-sedoheptulose 7-phosphate isomerase